MLETNMTAAMVQDMINSGYSAADEYICGSLEVTVPGCSISVEISIIGADGLPASQIFDSMDPYCTCEIDGCPESKITTPVVHATNAPRWTYTNVIKGIGEGQSLDFTVFDYDQWSAPDILGKARMLYGHFVNGYSGQLDLVEEGRQANATLSIQIEVLTPESGTQEEPCEQKLAERPAVSAIIPESVSQRLQDLEAENKLLKARNIELEARKKELEAELPPVMQELKELRRLAALLCKS